MNSDRKEALNSFARHYGESKVVKNSRMLSISPTAMKLEIDGVTLEIPFKKKLLDSEDAHKTLVAMFKRIKAETMG